MEHFDYTKEDMKALESLRQRGCAICVFTPEELNGAARGQVEDRLSEFGWQVIAALLDEGEAERT